MSGELSGIVHETSAGHRPTGVLCKVSQARQPTTPSPGSEQAPAAGPVHTSASRRRWLEVLPAVAGLGLFFAALEVLRIELRTVSWAQLMADVVRVPRPQLALAIALMVVNYVVLTAYDLIAFVYIGKTLPRQPWIQDGIPTPALSWALNYVDTYRQELLALGAVPPDGLALWVAATVVSTSRRSAAPPARPMPASRVVPNARTAPSFDNPDFVDVVIHSER